MACEDLKRRLLEKLKLFDLFNSGRMSISDLLDRYANFYYESALDGHEPEHPWYSCLKRFPKNILLHETVQYEYLDRIYDGPIFVSEENVERRLSPENAASELKSYFSTNILEDARNELNL